MKFGLILPSYLPQAGPEAMRRTARLAEELPYDSIWTTDHVMVAKSTPAPYQSIYEALTTLAWLAGVTSRVKLGVSVLILPQRNPIIVAKEVATLDALSGGRVILGLGTGWTEVEFGYLNADFHHRGAILNEGIQVLRSLWVRPDEPFQGHHFQFEGQSFAPPPVQAGGPPIWTGGDSEAALRRAATLADGWHATGVSPEQFKELAAKIASIRGSREVLLSLRGSIADQAGWQDSQRGRRYSMGGTMDEIRSDVLRFQDAGCTYIALNFWDGSPDVFFDRVERFAGEVVPRI